jgi:hypothetical protein
VVLRELSKGPGLAGYPWPGLRTFEPGSGPGERVPRPAVSANAGGRSMSTGAATPIIASSASDVAQLLAQRPKRRGGNRTLITGDGGPAKLSATASELAAILGSKPNAVVLIDLVSPSPPGAPGFLDLAAGSAKFEDVVQVYGAGLPSIRAGRAVGFPGFQSLAGNVGWVMEALDSSYGNVVIVADIDRARDLLEALNGNFGTGILVPATGAGASGQVEEGFLGYSVPGMTCIVLEAPSEPGPTGRGAVAGAGTPLRRMDPGFKRLPPTGIGRPS